MECEGEKKYVGCGAEDQMHGVRNFSKLPESDISDTLKKLSETGLHTANAEDVINKTIRITDNKQLNIRDVIYVTAILGNVAGVPNITKAVTQDILTMYSKVLDVDRNVLVEAQTAGNLTTRLLKNLDELPGKLPPSPVGFQRIVSEKVGVEVWDLSSPAVNDVVVGMQFSGNSNQDRISNETLKSLFNDKELTISKTECTILLSKEFMEGLVNGTKGGNVRLAMNIYQDTRMFVISQNSSDTPARYTLNSKVISAKITANGLAVTNLQGSKVTTIFTPVKKLSPELRGKKTVCCYWNFSANNNRGAWATDGCYHERVEDGRDVCSCDHLTNFAVLMDFHDKEDLPQVHVSVLSIITIIGLSLSIAGLSLTIVTFIFFKKLRQTRQQQTLLHLALAELCSWVIFLAGFNQTQNNAGCIAVAALLHYFILASFMWMLMEAVLFAILFIKVHGTTYSNYMLKSAMPAWGLPFMPVTIVLAVDYNLYRGGDTYCWMSPTPFYYAFAIPVGLIILANLVMYVMTMVSICRKSKSAVRNPQSGRQRTLFNLRASVFSFILLGLSWTFGYLAIFDARVVFQYVFTITCSTQGFFIFLIFTLRDKQVRESWRNLCCKKSKYPPSSEKSADVLVNRSTTDTRGTTSTGL